MQGGKCKGCGKKFEMRNMAVDHIRAFSRDGSDRLSNLQLLCTACNSTKGSGTMGQIKQRLKKQGVVKAPTGKKVTQAKKKPIKRKPRDPFDLF